MSKRIKYLIVAILLSALIPAVGYAALQFIYLSGPLGDQGTFPVLGYTNPIFSSDANHTATQAEYAGEALYVTSSTSLTATRTLVLPLTQGETKDVYNATSGSQTINVGGSSGTTVAVANGTYARVYCPDGANYVALTGSGGGGGGGAFDAAAFSGAPGFLYYDAGSVVWRNLASGDLPMVTLTGDILGDAANGTIPTTAVSVTGGPGPDDIQDGGIGILRIVADEVKWAADSGYQVVSGDITSIADASTWTNLMIMTPATNSGHMVEYEFNGWDLADQPDGGPADSFSCVFKFKIDTSNGGAIWYQPYPSNYAPVQLDASTPQCNVPFGSQDGGAISAPPMTFQLINVAGTIYLQWKSVPGQSVWRSSDKAQVQRRY